MSRRDDDWPHPDSVRLPPLNFRTAPRTSSPCVLPPLTPPATSSDISPYSPHARAPIVSPLPSISIPHPSSPVAPLNFSPLSLPLSSLSPRLPPLVPASSAFPSPSRLQMYTHQHSQSHTMQPSVLSRIPGSMSSSITSSLGSLSPISPMPVPRPIKRTVRTTRGIREMYCCPFNNCEKTSSEHSNMKAHMRMHTGEKPYVCKYASCNKRFRWKSSLTYHERALHAHAKPHKCNKCGRSFVEKRKLRMHADLCDGGSRGRGR